MTQNTYVGYSFNPSSIPMAVAFNYRFRNCDVECEEKNSFAHGIRNRFAWNIQFLIIRNFQIRS